jgi:hypothetical protein
MKPVAMSSAWPEVFAGPLWKAEMLRGELELEDIPSFIPDSNMKRLDPFDVGGNIFDFKLLVPAEHAARAREIVSAPRPEQYQARPSESLSDPRVDATTAMLEAEGRRIRWSAIVSVFAPYGLWLTWSYVPAAKKLATPPASHRWTLFASAICFLESAFALFFIAKATRFFGLEGLFNFLVP